MSARQVRAFGEQLFVGLLVMQIGEKLFAVEHVRQALRSLVVKNAFFVFEVAAEALFLIFEDQFRTLVKFSAFTRENLASTTVPSIPGGQ